MRALGTFVLQPFAADGQADGQTDGQADGQTDKQTAELSLNAEVSRSQTLLSIVYTLSGHLSSVVIPAVGQSSERRDRLWEKTCFEFFIMQGEKPSKTSPYWEFNLSPTGEWNVFALSGYRDGLKEESAFSTMPFTVRTSPTELYLQISVDIASLPLTAEPLFLGVSAVLLLAKERETFWAVAHSPSEADFHHPDSFVIPL